MVTGSLSEPLPDELLCQRDDVLGGAAFVNETGTTAQLVRDTVSGDASRLGALIGVASLWTIVVAVDFVWSFSYTLWPRER